MMKKIHGALIAAFFSCVTLSQPSMMAAAEFRFPTYQEEWRHTIWGGVFDTASRRRVVDGVLLPVHLWDQRGMVINFYDAPAIINTNPNRADNANNYYEFTNFWEGMPISVEIPALHSVTPGGVIDFKTAEHYFQARKFYSSVNPDQLANLGAFRAALDGQRGLIFNEIIAAPTARAAFQRAQQHAALVDPLCWVENNQRVVDMKFIVKAKFQDDPVLRRILLATRNRPLVEHTANDNFWGDDGTRSGRNVLGRILMEVRYELREEEAAEAVAAPGPRRYEEDEEEPLRNMRRQTALAAEGETSDSGCVIS